MILIEKAKEDFLKWLRNNYPLGAGILEWSDIRTLFLNALIIEWFDSVGIYITSDYFELNKGFYSEVLGSNFSIVKQTRQEAITEAIKKANEIYNRDFKNVNNL